MRVTNSENSFISHTLFNQRNELKFLKDDFDKGQQKTVNFFLFIFCFTIFFILINLNNGINFI